MRIHEIVFWGIVFFLVGIFIAPLVNLTGIAIAIVTLTIIGRVIAYRKQNKRIAWLAGLCMLMIIGELYWTGYNVYRKNQTKIIIGKEATVVGTVIDIRITEKIQSLVVELDEPNKGTLSVVARAYPVISHGDRVQLSGVVKRPDSKSWRYLIKDGIFATMLVPVVEIKEHNMGNGIKTKLLAIKQRVVDTYARALPADEAALLAGITIGERSQFDTEFKKQIANSGTTHLAALSG